GARLGDDRAGAQSSSKLQLREITKFEAGAASYILRNSSYAAPPLHLVPQLIRLREIHSSPRKANLPPLLDLRHFPRDLPTSHLLIYHPPAKTNHLMKAFFN